MPILTFDSIPHPAARRARRQVRPAPRAAVPEVAATDADAPSVLAAPKRSRVAVLAAILALHAGAGLVLTVTRKAPPAPEPEAVMVYIAPLRAEPPPPPPPPPPKVKLPPPQVVPAPPRIAVVAPPAVAASVAASPVVAVAVQAPVAEPVAVAPPPPPPPVEKVTEPRGYAGYLSNPAPEYPVAAQKRGLEGQVLLKVHVLPSGKPDDVTVARSSGHAILDDAALKAVMRWVFEPARRGQTPIDGWVQVPLNFRI